MRIIYFDGVCNLCNGFVDFVIRQDSQNTFYFAPLQGTTAQKELLTQDLGLDTVILSSNGVVSKKSQAVLMIFKELGPFFKIISALGNCLPTVFCDLIYDIVAKNRYRLFGQKETCRLPTAAERSRFLD
jgi:predicted DCC family thiol-disulfide oxidoreductase YuxK